MATNKKNKDTDLEDVETADTNVLAEFVGEDHEAELAKLSNPTPLIDVDKLANLKDSDGKIVELPHGDITVANEIGSKPNIRFVGRRVRNGVTESKNAPAQVKANLTFFDLPSDEEQKKGFYHPNAREIIRSYPKDYKQFVEKGESNDA